MATAATPFPTGADPANPNLVKVALTLDGRAMYFSRSVIPHQRDQAATNRPAYYLHLGIYAYRRDFLLRYTAWPPTPCELAEKLEQLRALEHGAAIGVVKVERASHGACSNRLAPPFSNCSPRIRVTEGGPASCWLSSRLTGRYSPPQADHAVG